MYYMYCKFKLRFNYMLVRDTEHFQNKQLETFSARRFLYGKHEMVPKSRLFHGVFPECIYIYLLFKYSLRYNNALQ